MKENLRKINFMGKEHCKSQANINLKDNFKIMKGMD